MRKQRILVVSPQKSGTHMICELMSNLGYRTFGWIAMESPPDFDNGELTSMATSVMRKHEKFVFSVARSVGLLKRLEQYAVGLLMTVWYERLGEPLASRHALQAVHAVYSRPNLRALVVSHFDSLLPNICLVKHELPLEKTDGAFIRRWSETGDPAIIFMYRDPRDVLCSFVRYLTGRTKRKEYGGFAEYYVYNSILESLPNDDERLMHAIIDPSFPGHRDYLESLWLLRHPNACKVKYEDLVGVAGGGSDQAQRDAVQRVLDHLGIDKDPEECANGIYNTKSFTFSKGQIGSWREMFKPAHHEAFAKQFGNILEWYGYTS